MALKSYVPAALLRELRILRHGAELYWTPQRPCSTEALRMMRAVPLNDLFVGADARLGWLRLRAQLQALGFPEDVGGVNPGDRRAIYHLLRYFHPGSVLEVGTHIGASTVCMATALAHNGDGGAITTVDIQDVNDPVAQPWRRFGSPESPRGLVEKMGYGASVRFVAQSSLDFLAQTSQRFDFIFLDGDHAAKTVYKELPLALDRLNPDGVVLLHDCYPGLWPLWPDGVVIPGPWMAIERLRREGASLRGCPLGHLPWETKQGRNVTSLALVLSAS